jgi:hypothetical protein
MMGFRFKVTGEAGICHTTTQKAIKRSAPVTAPFDSLFYFALLWICEGRLIPEFGRMNGLKD